MQKLNRFCRIRSFRFTYNRIYQYSSREYFVPVSKYISHTGKVNYQLVIRVM